MIVNTSHKDHTPHWSPSINIPLPNVSHQSVRVDPGAEAASEERAARDCEGGPAEIGNSERCSNWDKKNYSSVGRSFIKLGSRLTYTKQEVVSINKWSVFINFNISHDLAFSIVSKCYTNSPCEVKLKNID